MVIRYSTGQEVVGIRAMIFTPEGRDTGSNPVLASISVPFNIGSVLATCNERIATLTKYRLLEHGSTIGIFPRADIKRNWLGPI